MTPQEIFDKALVEVLKQGEPAMTATGGCDYWPGTGKMCAVGLLIGEKLAREWSAVGVGYVIEVESYKVKTPDWVESNLELLAGIQDAHDMFLSESQTEDIEYWRSEFIRKMKLVAKRHNLEYKEELERI
jgi:hypothetical protein